MSEIQIRPGGEGDFRTLMGLFDAAVEWLVARGSAVPVKDTTVQVFEQRV